MNLPTCADRASCQLTHILIGDEKVPCMRDEGRKQRRETTERLVLRCASDQSASVSRCASIWCLLQTGLRGNATHRQLILGGKPAIICINYWKLVALSRAAFVRKRKWFCHGIKIKYDRCSCRDMQETLFARQAASASALHCTAQASNSPSLLLRPPL